MTYASLEDAFGPMSVQAMPAQAAVMQQSFEESHGHFNEVAHKEKGFLINENKVTNCEDALKHIETCKKCKKKLMKRYKHLRQEIVENFENEKKSGKTVKPNEMFIMVLVGIFIIFALDIFVRLGKYINARTK